MRTRELDENDFNVEPCPQIRKHGVLSFRGDLFIDAWDSEGFYCVIRVPTNDWESNHIDGYDVLISSIYGKVEKRGIENINDAIVEANRIIDEQDYDDEPEPKITCMKCGWSGTYDNVGRKIIYEDFGDVDCMTCPSCGAIDYDGSLFNENM